MILFCDFDGTLFRKRIDGDFEKNLAAIQAFRAAGHKFVLTTGRGFASVKRAFANYEQYVDYLICDNGSVCFAGGEKLFELTIPEELAREVIDYFYTLPHADEFDAIYYRDGEEYDELNGSSTKLRLWVVNPEIMDETAPILEEHFTGRPIKFCCGHNMRPNIEVHESLRDYHRGAIDVMSIEAGKDNAIKRIVELNPEERVFAVGDGGNDLPMLLEYDGFIMETANSALREMFEDERTVDSVSGLIKRLMVAEDIEKQIDVDIMTRRQTFYKDGSTNSVVFDVDKEYLVKITDHKTVETQKLFLETSNNEAFQKLICCNADLEYECFEFINGDRFKSGMLDANLVIEQVARIVDGYAKYPHDGFGFLGHEKASWHDFLLDEIEYAKLRIENISQDKVMRALDVIGDYVPEQRLMHGDFGTHNFLVEVEKIRVIDPMPAVGDKLYDFYFAVLSNIEVFLKLGRERVFGFFDGYSDEYKQALFTIALYVRMSRAAVYDIAHLSDYIRLYEQ